MMVNFFLAYETSRIYEPLIIDIRTAVSTLISGTDSTLVANNIVTNDVLESAKHIINDNADLKRTNPRPLSDYERPPAFNPELNEEELLHYETSTFKESNISEYKDNEAKQIMERIQKLEAELKRYETYTKEIESKQKAMKALEDEGLNEAKQKIATVMATIIEARRNIDTKTIVEEKAALERTLNGIRMNGNNQIIANASIIRRLSQHIQDLSKTKLEKISENTEQIVRLWNIMTHDAKIATDVRSLTTTGLRTRCNDSKLEITSVQDLKAEEKKEIVFTTNPITSGDNYDETIPLSKRLRRTWLDLKARFSNNTNTRITTIKRNKQVLDANGVTFHHIDEKIPEEEKTMIELQTKLLPEEDNSDEFVEIDIPENNNYQGDEVSNEGKLMIQAGTQQFTTTQCIYVCTLQRGWFTKITQPPRS
jgi:hypothetical protein